MSSSIRISDETKAKLEALKRDDETFDELLDRLARTDKDVEAMAGWGEQDLSDHLETKRAALHGSLEARSERLE